MVLCVTRAAHASRQDLALATDKAHALSPAAAKGAGQSVKGRKIRRTVHKRSLQSQVGDEKGYGAEGRDGKGIVQEATLLFCALFQCENFSIRARDFPIIWNVAIS